MPQENAPPETTYIHGASEDEQARLTRLNDILNDACLAEIGINVGDRVLDVGSGLGQFSRRIARAAGATGAVVGIERDARQLQEARRLAAAEGEAEDVAFRQGDAMALPLNGPEWASFDIAHARFLLEHIPDPAAVVHQMARAVRPGGRVILCDDDHGDFRPWPEPTGFAPLWDAYVNTYLSVGNDPFVGRKLVGLLAGAGLRPVRNSTIFFGGCAGDDRFDAIADNLIGVLTGARDVMMTRDLLDPAAFDLGMAGLASWKSDPAASLWYGMCYAEGEAPA